MSKDLDIICILIILVASAFVCLIGMLRGEKSRTMINQNRLDIAVLEAQLESHGAFPVGWEPPQ